MSETISAAALEPGVAAVSPLPKVTEHPEPGGVNWTMRSKQFYQLLGWRLDADDAPGKNVRIVQFTPPGSGCSVPFGNGLTPPAPGSAAGARIGSDIEAAH